MSDIASWLLEQVAGDEERFEKLLGRCDWIIDRLKENQIAFLGREVPGWHEWPGIRSIVVQGLAECKAKRAIIERHIENRRQHQAVLAMEPDDVDDGTTDGVYAFIRYTQSRAILRVLVQPYADRHGFLDEWRLG
jgi:hypothetical protein